MSGMVWFVGAGPGDPELITVKGRRLVSEADLILYAGSLVPVEMTACAKAGARIIDSAPLNLEETHGLLREAVRSGLTCVRLHTGDSSIYGAVREQAALLEAEGIPYAVVPGVTAACAAAAAAKVSFTVPEVVQSLAVTRLDGRTPVPEGQRPADFARHGCSVAVYLSSHDAQGLVDDLRSASVPEDTPIVLASKVGGPEEKIVHTDLAGLVAAAAAHNVTRRAVFLILPGERGHSAPSRLYDKGFSHGYRQGQEEPGGR